MLSKSCDSGLGAITTVEVDGEEKMEGWRREEASFIYGRRNDVKKEKVERELRILLSHTKKQIKEYA